MPLELPPLPQRKVDSHKGDFGRALLIGGSTGMAGAIALSGIAALRVGAGLVTVATPASVSPIVAGFEPSYMTLPLAEVDGTCSSEAIATLLERISMSSCFAIGPGLGRSRAVTQVVSRLYRRAAVSGVFDADALFAIASSPRGLSQPAAPRIITPHLGEFRRLVDAPNLDRPQAIELAKTLAADHNLVVVLKGVGTLITDGERHVTNETGNPGLATGGTGDVLTGMICGLLAQGMLPFDAAVAAAHLHGEAGDAAAEELGEASLVASDLLKYLPLTIRKYVAAS